MMRREAEVHWQHPGRDSNNFKVMLDASVMELFSGALHLLQKSQSLNKKKKNRVVTVLSSDACM